MWKIIVSGAAALVFVANAGFAAPALSLSMTVGDDSHFADPQTVPTATSYTAQLGETITLGYEIRNTGDVTFTRHDLEDSILGEILNDFPFTIPPGETAFILQQYTVNASKIFSATWTVRNSSTGQTANASDSVKVRLARASMVLRMTVGDAAHFDDPQVLPTATTYLAEPGETITIGYEVENTGEAFLTRHSLQDSVLGTLLTDFPYTLEPGATAFLLHRVDVDATTSFSATWTGDINDGGLATPASDSLIVYVEGSEDGIQSADPDGDHVISMPELLRVIQLYNAGAFYCADDPEASEDGYLPGPGLNHTCAAHDTDYDAQDWNISLTELLRLLQFFNTSGYAYCPGSGSEDDYCPGS